MSTQSAEWIQAARVLRRVGFGARGGEVDAAVNRGDPHSYVRSLLSADSTKDQGVLATPAPTFPIPIPPEKSQVAERRRYYDILREQRRDLTHWWIRRMAAAEEPAREKLTFLWHNHFATSAAKVLVAELMIRQNNKQREMCLGDFQNLARAMLTDAAMIIWLDARQNRKGAPNENLAREFLELFTLGHGNGYTERDVREGARALTGWVISDDGTATLDEKRHDAGAKHVLGTSGEITPDELCEIVLTQPASATFVARRLWQQLASDSPPSRDVAKRLLKAYGANRDLKALTTAILTETAFIDSNATVVTPPVDWLIGVYRAVRAPLNDPHRIELAAATLKSLGQLPFHPPDVGGWPNGRAWLSTAAANIRFRAARRVVSDGDVSSIEEAATEDRIDATGYLIGVGTWSDRSVAALRPYRKHPAALVAAAVNTPEYLTS